MSFIIGSKCVSTCDTACVDVCPVACIHGPIKRDGEGREVDELRKAGKLEGLQLFINPDECIDCGMCLPEGNDGSVDKNYKFFGLKWN